MAKADQVLMYKQRHRHGRKVQFAPRKLGLKQKDANDANAMKRCTLPVFC